MSESEKYLSYVGKTVIECFEDAGLDRGYIDDKKADFLELSNFASLHYALRMLDDKNMVRLADKLGVTVSDLNITLSVLNKI